jgi:iron(III) transport system permease protein
MYQLVSQYPPRFPTAAAMGVSLFAVMFAMMWVYRRIVGKGSYATITGKAFRPRVMDVGPLRWPLLAACVFYLGVAVILPVLTIVYAPSETERPGPALINFTLANYAQFVLDAVRSALRQRPWLATASIGVAPWISLLADLPLRPPGAVIEYPRCSRRSSRASFSPSDFSAAGSDPDLRHAVSS